ncbi:MAG: nitroreductase family protein [Terracidiphilus sp.]
MTLSASEVNQLKRAKTLEGILPVIEQRWSPRAFADREVSTADLAKVFEAARWAPSSNNEQPWGYLLGFRNSDTHEKIASALMGFNQAWAPKAPVLILGVTRTRFARNGNPNNYALYDLGAATAFLILQAMSMGLHTHQMAGFDHEVARKALGIPEEYALGSVMALGYQDHPATLPNDKLVETETMPRTRKALSEFVLTAWGEPAKLA